MVTDPHEKEILFSPLMGQQALATRVHGSTLVVETRLNLNMQSLTLEEVASKRLKLLTDTKEGMASEIRAALVGTGYEEVGVLMFDAEVRRSGVLYHEGETKRDAEWFNDDTNFKKAVDAVVDAKQASMMDEDARLRWMANELSDEELGMFDDLLRVAVRNGKVGKAGFKAKNLRAVGFTVQELRAGGYGAAELWAGNFTLEELQAGGVTLKEWEEEREAPVGPSRHV